MAVVAAAALQLLADQRAIVRLILVDAPQRKFIVDHVQVRKAKVSYGGLVNADLPDLHLRDLGKKRGGATAAEIADEIWSELSRTAIQRAPAAIEGLRDKAKDTVERLRGLVK